MLSCDLCRQSRYRREEQSAVRLQRGERLVEIDQCPIANGDALGDLLLSALPERVFQCRANFLDFRSCLPAHKRLDAFTGIILATSLPLQNTLLFKVANPSIRDPEQLSEILGADRVGEFGHGSGSPILESGNMLMDRAQPSRIRFGPLEGPKGGGGGAVRWVRCTICCDAPMRGLATSAPAWGCRS